MGRTRAESCLRMMASLHGIGRALKRSARAEHGDSLGLLIVLQAVATPGQARASELAEQLFMDLSVVSRKLSTLEARGLVERIVDPRDRRAQLVALTPSGAALLASLRASAGASLATGLPGWSVEDLELLVRLLARLEADLTSFDADRGTPSPLAATTN